MSFIEKSSVVKFLSKLKSLKNLRIQAIGEIDDLTLLIFCSNKLSELKSYECINSEYSTTVIFTWPIQTNIEYLTIDCILYNLSNILLQTPKLKYLNINLTNFQPEDRTKTNSSLPLMINLKDLKMKIHFVSFIQLSDIIKSMPNLEKLELSGSSMGKNLDNGHQLKQLFGHLQEVQLENLECLTSTSSIDTILSTFDDINEFWSDVTCSIKYDRVYLSAFGYRK